MTTQAEKCRRLAELHAAPGAFIIPNPWDAGSARLLQGKGFQALATTSAGFAFTLARTDGQPTLEEKLAHCAAVCAALAWAALAPAMAAGREMAETGSFGWLQHAAAGAEIGKLLNG